MRKNKTMFVCNKEKNRYIGEEDFFQSDYMFPHEFMYLVPNCEPRNN